MKFIPLKVLCAVLFSAASSQAVVVDFNSLSGSQGSSFAVGAVTFSVSGATLDARLTPNGTQGIIGGTTVPFSPIRATIAGGTSSVAVDLGDFNGDGDTIFLEIFSASNISLGFTSLGLDPSFTGMMTLGLSAPDISYAVFGSTAPSLSGSSVFADNFTYSAATGVPDGGSAIALLGSALVGLAALRRRLLS